MTTTQTSQLESLDDAELNFLLTNLDQFDLTDQEEIDLVLVELERRQSAQACRDDLI